MHLSTATRGPSVEGRPAFRNFSVESTDSGPRSTPVTSTGVRRPRASDFRHGEKEGRSVRRSELLPGYAIAGVTVPVRMLGFDLTDATRDLDLTIRAGQIAA